MRLRFGLFFSIDCYRTNETVRLFATARTPQSRKAILYVLRRFNLTATERTVDGRSRSCRSRLDLIESRTVLPEERGSSFLHLMETTSRPHIKQRATITLGIGSRQREASSRAVYESRVNICRHLGGTRDNGRVKLYLEKVGRNRAKSPLLIADNWTFVADQCVARSLRG